MTTSISALIHADLLRRVKRAAEREQAWLESQHHYLPLFESIAAKQAALAAGESLEVEASTFGLHLTLSIAGGPDLLQIIWRALRVRGWRFDGDRPKALETSWSGSFHLFAADGERVPGVEVLLSFSSTVCRLVQVGTKMVEKPIYEVRCTSDSLPITEDSLS